LLSRIVQKRFGGVQGLSEMADLAANVAGTATIADGSSGPQEWKMQVTQQRWGSITVEFRSNLSPKDQCTRIKVGQDCSVWSEACNKGKPNSASPQLNRAAVLFAQHQVHGHLARLLTRRVIDIPGSEKNEITTDVDPDSYVLSLEPVGWPAEIAYRAGPDATPVKVHYANYSEEKGRPFAHRVTIGKGVSDTPAAEFSLSSIGPPPALPNKNDKKKTGK